MSVIEWMFTNILGFEAMPTGLEMVFGFCALIGVFEGVVEGVFDIDVDMGSDFSFKAITFQGVVAFVMMFGLVGLAVMQSTTNDTIAVFGGSVAGIMSMFAINKLFHMFYGLESDGTVQHNQAIGAKGLVTTRIRKGSPGEVQVTYQHALRTEAAVCEDEDMELSTGTMIEVVDVIGTRLIVKKYGSNQNEEE